MPNKYEREIEEILRNLEQTEPNKAGVGQKFNERLRRRPVPRPRPRSVSTFSLTLTVSDWLLLITIGIALVAGGCAYIIGGTIITGILAIVGLVCIILVALSQIIFKARRPSSVRFGNTTITPLRRGPLHTLKTRWNLFMLKMRYHKRKSG